MISCLVTTKREMNIIANNLKCTYTKSAQCPSG